MRDASGDLSWLQPKGLVANRNMQVSVANAKIRANSDDAAVVVLSANKGVLLKLLDPVAFGWFKVRYRDGQSGYVKASEVCYD